MKSIVSHRLHGSLKDDKQAESQAFPCNLAYLKKGKYATRIPRALDEL
jgi:hypothetical protein